MKDQANKNNPAINKGYFLDLLRNHFPEEDARLLVYFFQNLADAECFSYKDLQLPQEEAQDLSTIMANSRNRLFEAGLLDLYHQQINARVCLHDILDLFVISGVMSPCPARSLNTGLSWYEISPVCWLIERI